MTFAVMMTALFAAVYVPASWFFGVPFNGGDFAASVAAFFALMCLVAALDKLEGKP
jgi:hypothetical protein